MEKPMDYEAARELLLAAVRPVGTETVALERAFGRILAQPLTAREDVPPFDRSPYDGYAFRAADTAGAARESPVTLALLEEIAAGGVPHYPVTPGTAVKILTGAPIPAGADAVEKFELTRFTAETVTLFAPLRAGENIVYAGEDVRAGQLLARAGCRVDSGTAGTLAAQGVDRPLVYRLPRVGIVSTGDELVEAGEALVPGKIRNTNRSTFEAILLSLGCEPVYLGIAADRAEAVCERILAGAAQCDAVLLTGGACESDYDMTPAAIALAGAETLVRKVDLKPGGACVYGLLDGKLICGLSGNPASSATNFFAVALPAIKRLAGWAEPAPREIRVALTEDYPKSSPKTRLLRGELELSDGTARLRLRGGQGNAVLSSMIGCDAMAVVPAGSGPLPAGTCLKGFMI